MYIGIDIGGTGTVAALISADGRVMSKTAIQTGAYPDPESFVNALVENINNLSAGYGGPGVIRGIGIGAPNGNYYSGSIQDAPNLRWKGNIPLVALIGEHFAGIPVKLTNDANAAAIGEWTFGAARGMRDFIVITLGTGVGSGLFANGQLIYGHDGFAGEIGHAILYPEGRPCGCGRQGCVETYASAGGLVKTGQELLASTDMDSVLRGLETAVLSAKNIGEAAAMGDPVAMEALDQTAKHLALALSNAVCHTSPEAIILFGGLTKAGATFLTPLKQYFEANLLPIYRNKIQLLVSSLPDEDAALLGAASLVMH
ncbi:MAG: ROK family protein [Lentimicrobiaceae bacterium]|nr:ROK family protein [Lentimicrobiaceae bacterium]